MLLVILVCLSLVPVCSRSIIKPKRYVDSCGTVRRGLDVWQSRRQLEPISATFATITGGIAVAKSLVDLIQKSGIIESIKKERERFDKMLKTIVDKADFYRRALGEKYQETIKILADLSHKSKLQAEMLLELAFNAWVNSAGVAKDILSYGYGKKEQDLFVEFLETSIKDAENIIKELQQMEGRLKEAKSRFDGNRVIVDDFFERENKELVKKGRNANRGYWWCLTIVGCPIAAGVIEGGVKKALKKTRIELRKISRGLRGQLQFLQKSTKCSNQRISTWKKQATDIKRALKQTNESHERLLPTLQHNYKDKQGRQNGYLTDLFHDMILLQNACEQVFDADTLEKAKQFGKKIKPYPKSHDVCVCLLEKKNADWKSNSNCINAISQAREKDDDFPFCRLKNSGCVDRIRKYIEKQTKCRKELRNQKTDEICYAERYHDLFRAFCGGKKAKTIYCDVNKLRDHWERRGKKEKRKFGCSEESPLVSKLKSLINEVIQNQEEEMLSASPPPQKRTLETPGDMLYDDEEIEDEVSEFQKLLHAVEIEESVAEKNDFVEVTAGTCESNGYKTILDDIQLCSRAASYLSKTAINVRGNRNTIGRPAGCIYANNDWLQLNSATSTSWWAISTHCGTHHEGQVYTCLCARVATPPTMFECADGLIGSSQREDFARLSSLLGRQPIAKQCYHGCDGCCPGNPNRKRNCLCVGFPSITESCDELNRIL